MPDVKRFAFVVSDLYGGGAQRVLLNAAEGLRQRGHQICVYLLRDKIEHRIPSGLEVVNLAVVNRITKALANPLLEKWQAHTIKRALEAFRPDITICCSCDKITRHIKGLNLYLWVHSNSVEGLPNREQQKKLIYKLQRLYQGKKLIVVSKGIKHALVTQAGLTAESIKVIYNPFDQDCLKEGATEETLPRHLPKEYFIHVGTFEIRKRHDRLLRAYRESGSQTPLVIMGKGSAAETQAIGDCIKDLGLEDKVIVMGYQANPYPLIASAKALLLTSDREGLPTVLIEALLLHTPVISVDCPSGPSEILTHELVDYLIPPENEKGLANAIKRMDQAPVIVMERHYKQFLKETVLPQFEAL
ncbi:glycosyltransferase [Halomonas korlensis]|uniref:Glycosyltransferase involved in cell wall bisynthesis n=1 Tax=Halomonas korlensis TaxID=463301 RepID=A0A1I7G3W5_9GAMM|nr:glycosyltransferase [Halomonas korlensis]SFU43149.1 Glycosyltransferase involved in cell wall bisynthesis [Halomonas korlensis]